MALDKAFVVTMSTDDIATSIQDIKGLRAAVLAQLELIQMDMAVLEAEILARIKAAGGTSLLAPGWHIEAKQKRELVKYESEFLKLFDVGLPRKEVDKAVRWVPPSTEPILKTDAAGLKDLAKRYGGVVAEIAKKAIGYNAGPTTLICEPNDQLISGKFPGKIKPYNDH